MLYRDSKTNQTKVQWTPVKVRGMVAQEMASLKSVRAQQEPKMVDESVTKTPSNTKEDGGK